MSILFTLSPKRLLCVNSVTLTDKDRGLDKTMWCEVAESS